MSDTLTLARRLRYVTLVTRSNQRRSSGLEGSALRASAGGRRAAFGLGSRDPGRRAGEASGRQRWRETFAEKLREWGIDAEATRQATRGRSQNYEPLWRIKALQDKRLRSDGAASNTKWSKHASRRQTEAAEAWAHIAQALVTSPDPADLELGLAITKFVRSETTLKTRATPVRTTEIASPAPSLKFEQRR